VAEHDGNLSEGPLINKDFGLKPSTDAEHPAHDPHFKIDLIFIQVGSTHGSVNG
jgi:hypothetical protein